LCQSISSTPVDSVAGAVANPSDRCDTGLCLLVLAIGLLETDGFLLLMGYGMTLATTFFFASIAGFA